MFKKPNQKTITDAGITAVAFVAGAKVGDGIAAVMPQSVAPYKKWGLAAAGIVLAASISGTSTGAKAAQSAALGMASKQLLDEVTDKLTTAVKVKDSSSVTNKFINAVVGHNQTVPIAVGVGAPWNEGVWDEGVWDRGASLSAPDEYVQVFDGSSMI